MKKKTNWWVWLGLGLLVLLIAFKFGNRENFVRSPLLGSGIKSDEAIINKFRAIAVYLGYDKKDGEYALDLFRSEKAMYIYQAQTKRISIDEFVSQVTNGKQTEFSKLPNDSSKREMHIMYEYLYNQPEQTSPLSFVRLV